MPLSNPSSLRRRSFLSFGITAKLVLAMTLLVTLACTSTVWFVDLEVKRTYQAFCKQQFYSEWQFLAQEAGRFSEAKTMMQAVLQGMPAQTIRTLVKDGKFESMLSESMLTTLGQHGYQRVGLL